LGKEKERVERIDGVFNSAQGGIGIGGSLIGKSAEALARVPGLTPQVLRRMGDDIREALQVGGSPAAR